MAAFPKTSLLYAAFAASGVALAAPGHAVAAEPLKSCDAFLKDGSGQGDCKAAVIAVTRKASSDVMDILTNPVPGLVNPMGALYSARIKDACAPVSALTGADGLTATVLAADRCLKTAYGMASERQSGEAAQIADYAGSKLVPVARKLIALSKPSSP
jgi:hypothetical protein